MKRSLSVFDVEVNHLLLLKRMFPFIKEKDGCWLWKGTRASGQKQNGQVRLPYGRVSVAGCNMYVHVVLYELYTGKALSKRRILRHTCRNACCNPKHLIPGTYRQNALDSIRDGTHRCPRGDTHHQAKLTYQKAGQIRKLFARGKTRLELAEKFGVSRSVVNAILRNEAWVK